MEHYSPKVKSFMEIVDKDNGKNYARNLPQKGQFIKFEKGNTKMFYDTKIIDGVRIVLIRYVHYDNIKELYDLLAFAVQWWYKLKPSIIYLREKERQNAVGKYLKKLGFQEREVPNKLLPFDCLIDGKNCNCPVFEYAAFNVDKKAPATYKDLPTIE